LQGIFYLVGCAAYRQHMFCILYSCVFWTIFLHVFMHVNVSGRSVLLFNKLIDCRPIWQGARWLQRRSAYNQHLTRHRRN